MQGLEQAVAALLEKSTELLQNVSSFIEKAGSGTVSDEPKLNEIAAKVQSVTEQLTNADNELKSALEKLSSPAPAPVATEQPPPAPDNQPPVA